MREHPIKALVQRIRPSSAPFNPTMVVGLWLSLDDCREEVADRARRWCAENCEAPWQPVERWSDRAVRIGFESATDALAFSQYI